MESSTVFAVVATVTFLLLEPFISERLNSGKEVETEPAVSVIDFSESTEDEMLPEDMYATDKEMISN